MDRNSNIDSTITVINKWVDLYFDKLFYDMVQVLNTQNVYLVNSTDNKINDLESRLLALESIVMKKI